MPLNECLAPRGTSCRVGDEPGADDGAVRADVVIARRSGQETRLLVRWEYYPVNFLGFVQLAAVCVLLRHF
jgi:hypothetical protein